MKKILLSCACCLLAVGLLAGCDTEEEVVTPDEPDTSVPSTGGDDGGSGSEPGETVYKLGALDTTTYEYVYFSGEASGNFLGVTSSWDEAAPVTFEEVTSEEGFIAVSISFVDAEGATKYISWSDNTKVDIKDEPYAWYWVEENTIFAAGSSEGRALVYYEKDPSFRAYAQNESNLANSHVRVYTAEPEAPEAPEPIEPVLGTVTEGQYFLGVTMSEVTYYFDGTLSGYYGSVSPNGYDAAVVTVAAVSDGYTLSVGEEDAVQYLYGYVSNGYVDLGLQTDPFTWQYDTAFSTFVIKLNDQWNFLGTFSTNVRIGLSDYGYLTGDTATSYAQYPAKLFDVITYVAPTSITISGESEVIIGSTIQLTATVAGNEGENVSGKVIWASSEEGVATISDTGVVKGISEGTTNITAKSALNEEIVSSEFSITVSASNYGYAVVAEDWATTYEDTTFKLGVEYSEGSYCYLDGYVEGNYTYEATVALNFDTGVDITVTPVEDGADNEYYLTYPFGDETYYICIIPVDSYTDLQLTTEAHSMFWDETNSVWTNGNNEAETHFLSYNSTYGYITQSEISNVETNAAAQLMVWEGVCEEHDQISYPILIDQLGTYETEDETSQETVTKDYDKTDISGKSTEYEGCEVSWTGGGSYGIQPYSTLAGYRPSIRIYSNTPAFTITPKEGCTITRVVFESAASNSNIKYPTESNNSHNGAYTSSYSGGTAGEIVTGYIEDYVQVIMSGDSTSLTVSRTGNAWYLAYITVYYTTAD